MPVNQSVTSLPKIKGLDSYGSFMDNKQRDISPNLNTLPSRHQSLTQSNTRENFHGNAKVQAHYGLTEAPKSPIVLSLKKFGKATNSLILAK
jgi:hypothetical protein